MHKSLKIGLVCYPTFGGSGIVATELGKALAEKGHEIHYDPVASYSQMLHSDLTFSITLDPQNGSGAVRQTPKTPQHSPTLRGWPRGALFCIVLSPGPIVFCGPFDARVLALVLINFCAFGTPN